MVETLSASETTFASFFDCCVSLLEILVPLNCLVSLFSVRFWKDLARTFSMASTAFKMSFEVHSVILAGSGLTKQRFPQVCSEYSSFLKQRAR